MPALSLIARKKSLRSFLNDFFKLRHILKYRDGEDDFIV